MEGCDAARADQSSCDWRGGVVEGRMTGMHDLAVILDRIVCERGLILVELPYV
jgi:hypothetical protein